MISWSTHTTTARHRTARLVAIAAITVAAVLGTDATASAQTSSSSSSVAAPSSSSSSVAQVESTTTVASTVAPTSAPPTTAGTTSTVDASTTVAVTIGEPVTVTPTAAPIGSIPIDPTIPIRSCVVRGDREVMVRGDDGTIIGTIPWCPVVSVATATADPAATVRLPGTGSAHILRDLAIATALCLIGIWFLVSGTERKPNPGLDTDPDR